jgi:hypothetical protein
MDVSNFVLTEKLKDLCKHRPSRLSEFGFSPVEIDRLISGAMERTPGSSGKSHDTHLQSDHQKTNARPPNGHQTPRIPDIDVRINHMENLISPVIVSEPRCKKYARQLVVSGITTQGEFVSEIFCSFLIALFTETIASICSTKPTKLKDFGFTSAEVDLMVQRFKPPEIIDSNGRTAAITSNDLDRLVVEVETLIRPVIASDPRCKKYARQMAMSGISTHGEIDSSVEYCELHIYLMCVLYLCQWFVLLNLLVLLCFFNEDLK